MAALAGVLCVLLTWFPSVTPTIVIPDQVSYTRASLVYYSNKGTWYQARRLCRSGGGHLVLVDGQHMASHLGHLVAEIGSISHIFTRLVRHDNQQLMDDAMCVAVNTSSWGWDNTGDAAWDSSKQCVLADPNTFLWKKRECDAEDEFVCEYQNEPCLFEMHSAVSLAVVPLNNASTESCQSLCRQMVGCFGTAPSGDVTLGTPLLHCIVLVVGDSTNPMSALSCQDSHYSRNDVDNAKDQFPDPYDPQKDPVDCTHTTTASPSVDTGPSEQWPLTDFLTDTSAQFSASCSETVVVEPTTVLKTVYVTLTPDVITDYVTVTPNVITEYVTATPEIKTSFVTVTPEVQTVYVTAQSLVHTVTLWSEDVVRTVYVTVAATPTAADQVTTATTTVTTIAEVTLTSTVCPTPSLPIASTQSVVHNCPTTTSSTPTPALPPSSVTANKTRDEVMQDFSSVVHELTVDPSTVSKARRQKESAPDSRPSAQTMGSIAVLLLVLPPVLILLLDLPALLRALCCRPRPRPPRPAGDGGDEGRSP